MARSARRSFPARSRRKTAWEIGPETGTNGSAQVIAGTVATLATTVATVGQDGITLIRTRGELLLYLTVAS